MSTPLPDSPSTSTTNNTYEATKARERILRQPDKVVWDSDYAYRQSPYRLLHHQKGIMGYLQIRLLEANDLQRSYWSALALIPGVKHLGLSKAHGKISSFAQICVKEQQQQQQDQGTTTKSTSTSFQRHNSNDVMTSPVIVNNNHPVWSNCVGELPLRKSYYNTDGQAVVLQVQLVEEASGVEHKMSAVPLLPSQDDRILGTGELDVTQVLLLSSSSGKNSNGSGGGVMDVWMDIRRQQPKEEREHDAWTKDEEQAASLLFQDQELLKKPAAVAEVAETNNNQYETSDDDDNNNNNNNNSNVTGRVRLLVSYRPIGLTPQQHDLVALESFARRSPRHSSCLPLLPPLMPMKVLQTHNAFLLVEYRMPGSGKATMRLPRNAVFVIERTNIVDGAINFALLPTDFFFSTPVGHKTRQVAGPLVGAATEVAMPALLSAKLVWTAVSATTGAGLTGVQAATNAILKQSRDAHEHRHQQQSFHANSSSNSSATTSVAGSTSTRGGAAQQQYVSL